MKKIAIVGTGYVGLVHGATLAHHGNQVVCLDIDSQKVESLKNGVIPFYEPGLKELVREGIESGNLKFTNDYAEAIPKAEVCFLCLPTPSSTSGSCDLSYVFKAASQVAEAMTGHLVVVNKSTVPVGTAEAVRETITRRLKEKKRDYPFEVASNPEFLREGAAVNDSMHPSRIIIGVSDKLAKGIMWDLYASFSLAKGQMMIMDIHSAELAKYAANTMLASRLSMMNTLSQLCEQVGGNIGDVQRAIGADPRIGPSYLSAGLGFGGSCLPKDVAALLSTLKENNIDPAMLESILRVNHTQRECFFKKIQGHFDTLEGKTIALWGLSFKPDTDDMRDAPSLDLIQRCLDAGAQLRVYDPVAIPNAQDLLKGRQNIYFCKDEYDAAQGADGIALVTEWPQFRSVDFEKLAPIMKEKVVFDGRNQFRASEMENWGFSYYPIGSPASHPLSVFT